MTFRVEVFPRGHGGSTDSEASTISAWRQELFADDQYIIDAFTWQNKNDIGFCIQTYSERKLIGFAHVFARVGRLDDSPVLMGCLGSVMTAREHQGTGVGSTTVRTAGEVILKTCRQIWAFWSANRQWCRSMGAWAGGGIRLRSSSSSLREACSGRMSRWCCWAKAKNRLTVNWTRVDFRFDFSSFRQNQSPAGQKQAR